MTVPTTYFFQTPFASAGDKTTIPVPTQGDGSVSLTSGWPINYQLRLNIDPGALPLDRQQTNQMFNWVTMGLQQYQVYGVPNFISTSDNGGTAFSYDAGAWAYYLGNIYQSKVGTNTALPTVKANWRLADNNAGKIIYDNATLDATVIVNGQVVYYDGTNFKLAQAVATAAINAIGIADLTNSRVYTSGYCPLFTGLTPGSVYYLSSATPGAITTVVPDNYVVQIGVAISTTEMLLQIAPGQARGAVPAGSFLAFNGTSPPLNYLIEDGSSLLVANYPDLFTAIGYTWGGSGANFNLPDSRGRSFIGAGTGSGLSARTVGQIGGDEEAALIAANHAVHNHGIVFSNTALTCDVPPADGSFAGVGTSGPLTTVTAPAATELQGSGTPFSIMMPFNVKLPCIKVNNL